MRVALLEQTTTDHVILGIPAFTHNSVLTDRLVEPVHLGNHVSDGDFSSLIMPQRAVVEQNVI